MMTKLSEPFGFDAFGGSSRKVIPVCVSFCEGFCGMDWDEDDDDTRPSSADDYGLCLDDGENKGCDEFYSENE